LQAFQVRKRDKIQVQSIGERPCRYAWRRDYCTRLHADCQQLFEPASDIALVHLMKRGAQLSALVAGERLCCVSDAVLRTFLPGKS
jgi:hypothetical protein